MLTPSEDPHRRSKHIAASVLFAAAVVAVVADQSLLDAFPHKSVQPVEMPKSVSQHGEHNVSAQAPKGGLAEARP